MLRPVCPLGAIPRGEAYRWDTDPPVAIFHTDDGEVFAVDDTCTHQDASLADGWLEGCEVECRCTPPGSICGPGRWTSRRPSGRSGRIGSR